MFKVAVGHQIPSPAMSDLMSDQINKRTIASLTQNGVNLMIWKIWNINPGQVFTIIVGVTKVKQGFSIPPKGNEGGKTNKSYTPQT